MDTFQFIKDVALDRDDSRKLEAEPRQNVTIARTAKGSGEWFVRNVSGEADHLSRIDFGFLDDRKKYRATIYADAVDAHYKTNPQTYTISGMEVINTTTLEKWALGSGFAIRIIER